MVRKLFVVGVLCLACEPSHIGAGPDGSGGPGGEYPLPFDAGRRRETCPCTRRPGGELLWSCPHGSGASVLRLIGPDGGTVSLDQTAPALISGAPAQVDIGASVFESEVSVTLAELETPPPEGFVDYSPLHFFWTERVALANAVALTIPLLNTYSPDNFGGSVDLFWAPSVEGPYEPIQASDTGSFMSAWITEAGYYFAGFPETDATRECVPEAPPVDPGFSSASGCPCSRRDNPPDGPCRVDPEVSATIEVGLEGATLTAADTGLLSVEIYYGGPDRDHDEQFGLSAGCRHLPIRRSRRSVRTHRR